MPTCSPPTALASAQVAEARARLARLEARTSATRRSRCCEAQEKRAEAARRSSPLAELERQQTLRLKGTSAQAQFDIAQANPIATRPRSRGASPDHGRAHGLARRGHRGGRQSLAAAIARRDASQTKLARRKLAAPVGGTVQQVYYRPGEMVPASRPVVSILPPGNIKLRFFVAQALLPKIAPGDAGHGDVRRLPDGSPPR